MPKLKNLNATFWVIFKHYALCNATVVLEEYWTTFIISGQIENSNATILVVFKHCAILVLNNLSNFRSNWKTQNLAKLWLLKVPNWVADTFWVFESIPRKDWKKSLKKSSVCTKLTAKLPFLEWNIPGPQCLKIAQKSRVQHCERSELTFWVDKSSLKNAKNCPFWRVFEKKLAAK